MNFELTNYYIGLDIGTDSVGWAVTDADYNLCKFNGKSMWGTHLFLEGKSAEARRLYRTNKRRLNRRKFRILLLRELFEPEISKVDGDFFRRLDDSKYWENDKGIAQPYSLFNDKDYSDVQYHKEFPTIYHLRKAIIDSPNRKFDIRLIYLAAANILKHRGHFLLAGQRFSLSDSFEQAMQNFACAFADVTGTEYCEQSRYAQIKAVLSQGGTKTHKKKQLSEISVSPAFSALVAGCKVKLTSLFEDEENAEPEIRDIDFSSADYDDISAQLRATFGDKMDAVDAAKLLYDWSVLNKILNGNTSISEAKTESYEKHKSDLARLKKVMRENCSREAYAKMFRDTRSKTNYCAYIGRSDAVNNTSVCTASEFYKYVKSVLAEVSDDNRDKAYLLGEIESGNLCPKQVTGENAVIPYQLHLDELQRILENSAEYYPFLNRVFSDGTTVRSRILSIMTFRIPYYVGPLNAAHKDDKKHGHAWIEKKSDESIRPWNFEEVVDLAKSGENFVRRMTNRCTYLIDCDVLPKDSLLYSRFMMLNEINRIKLNGQLLDVQTKKALFEDLCLSKPRLRLRDVKKYLISLSMATESDVVDGTDDDIKASMKPHIDFKGILTESEWDEQKIEQSILTLVLFAGEKKIIAERLNAIWKKTIPEAKTAKIAGLKYSGWGRLSKEFLTEIYHADKETGEALNIIGALYETNANLMQLLSSRWDYLGKVETHNAEVCDKTGSIEYEAVVQPLYCSPAVKRGIWRTLSVVQEIVKIAKHPPAKIFVEVAREEGEKKRTVSRKSALLALYGSCKKEAPSLYASLDKQTEGELRSDKLYLYYTQLGRCMYSGDEIDINKLFDDNAYDVDHIFPRSRTKDDSLENRVLVKKELNALKSDDYPIPPQFQTARTRELWKRLLAMGLIGKTKYERLNRTVEFSDDELAGFISRQLVETRQSTKAVAQALTALFSEADTDIVYVKAGHVSDFRKNQELPKVREINDLHHAKDAYLNIVVGNVYNTKFTANPVNFVKNAPSRSYNLSRMFDFDVKRGGVTAWVQGSDGTIATVKKTMRQNRILFTRYAYVANGEFYCQMPLKKGHGQIPLKSGDARMHDIQKYGGYDSDATACFFYVEHSLSGERVRTIEYIPIRRFAAIDGNVDALLEFCKQPLPFGLGLSEPRILIDKIKIDSLIVFNGFPTHLSGRSMQSLTLKPAVQLIVDEPTERYLKKVVKYVERCKALRVEPETAEKRDLISAEENIAVYRTLLEKHRSTIYALRPNLQLKTLENGLDTFAALGMYKQCYVLTQILLLMKCAFVKADLSDVGGSKNAGIATKNKKIQGNRGVTMVHQSVTGLFENSVDLLKL